MWVFRIKRNPSGSVDKYHAQLVAKGRSQRPGINFDETFSSVTRLDTRSFIAIAVSEKMFTQQFDVSTAFLYGYIEEEIYMKQPDGYSDGTSHVCRVLRSLYGFKQPPRQ